METLLAQTAARGEVGERPRVALVGLPNVGKSSLFNALVGRAGAIVSSQAGTTRDYLTAVCLFGGIECELIDTAGIEGSSTGESSIAAAAQDFAVDQARDADLRVLCLDASRSPRSWETDQLAHQDPHRIVVRSKSDLAATTPSGNDGLYCSAHAGQGLDALRSAIGAAVADARHSGDIVAATAVRCRDSLHRAAGALDAAHTTAANRGGDELVALELRTALDELGQIVGVVYTDDILDRIFSRFCIGK